MFLYLLVARLRSDVGRVFGFEVRCLRGGGPLAGAGADFGFREKRENELCREVELPLEREAGLEKTELGALVELEVERGRERVLLAGDAVLLRACRDRLLRTERGIGSSKSHNGTTISTSSFAILIKENTR